MAVSRPVPARLMPDEGRAAMLHFLPIHRNIFQIQEG